MSGRDAKGAEAMTPPCARCGFEIDREEFVYSAKHMVRIRCAAGEEWICEEHRTAAQEILEVVKTGAAEQARLARPPLAPRFWPREVLNYDDLQKGRRR
jgi:hypothetical protein